MKNNFICWGVVLAHAVAPSSFAGSVAGTGGGTEVTQIANNIQLVQQYQQTVQGYVRQGLQLQNELKNLTQNPASLLGSEVGRIINGVGSIMSAGNSIGGGMAQINKNFDSTFKSPTAATLAQSFTKWNNTSTSTLEGAMKAAGMHRDATQSDTDALNALYVESQAADGNLKAIQTLSKINSMQVQQMQKLQDLLATQNIASTTYMASQTAKAEAKNQQEILYSSDYDKSIPEIQMGAPKRWKEIYKK